MGIDGWGDLGSSPLARGLPAHGTPATWSQRIIPARAGFTPPKHAVKCCHEDHPRSRGVYKDMRDKVVTATGSSPLARGLPPLTHLLA